MTKSQLDSDHGPHPVQVAMSPGMPVCEIGDGTPGRITGITQAFCLYRLGDGDTLCVANWRDIAVGNTCPAPTLLPASVRENDLRNASATVLRELLSLQHLGPLTPSRSGMGFRETRQSANLPHWRVISISPKSARTWKPLGERPRSWISRKQCTAPVTSGKCFN